VDKCQSCAKFDIDLSPAAFDKLAPAAKGRSISPLPKANSQNSGYVAIYLDSVVASVSGSLCSYTSSLKESGMVLPPRCSENLLRLCGGPTSGYLTA
jgi:hypothetical protein